MKLSIPLALRRIVHVGKRAAALGVFALMGVQVARAVLAPNPLLARAEDRRAATVELAASSDRRAEPPSGAFVSGVGVVEPLDGVVRVAGEGGGRVQAVLVRAGERVSQGAPLVRLESAAEQARLAVAEAELDAALADLSVARAGRPEDVRAAAGELDAARARAALSRDAAERAAKLGESLPEAERTRQRLGADADAAAVIVAEARLEAVRRGARIEARSGLSARVSAARARVALARAELAHRTIVAPRDGDVLDVLVKPGERYDPAAGPAAWLGDRDHMTIRMEVDERAIAQVVMGASAKVRSPSYPRTDIEATVLAMQPKMGRRKVQGDDAAEPVDVRVREVILSVPKADLLVVGQRVDCYVESRP